MNQVKLIREELSYIGRYLESISPKLSKYQELKTRQELLRKQLKELGDNVSGVNPAPMKKFDHTIRDMVPTIRENRGATTNVYKKTKRSYSL